MRRCWTIEQIEEAYETILAGKRALVMSLRGGHHIFEVITPCPTIATFQNRENGFVFYDNLSNYTPWRPAFEIYGDVR